MHITAVQDRDCLDRAKFRYDLPMPLPKLFFDQFSDATMIVREFSKIVPRGRDLFNIVKAGVFRADGIVGDSKMIVSFHGDPRNWPRAMLDNFAHRLTAAGYGEITYLSGAEPNCADCPARFAKKCRGLRGPL